MRMNMRRFTRLTDGFSKKFENHAAMVSFHFLNYNYIRKHQTIKTASATVAGVNDKPMKMEEACELFSHCRERNYPVNRHVRYKKPDCKPVNTPPQTLRTPWYLDAESGGANPAPENRKLGIEYEND